MYGCYSLWMILHLLSVFGLVSATIPATAETPPPNVVLIISDDQAWTDFGFMGHPHIETPNLDRLARESLVFTHGYVPSSLCCPSLATMITGRYPFEHGITGNEPPRPDGRSRRDAQYQADLNEMINLIDRSPALPRLLKARGYRSFQSGKWWLGDYTRGGFTHGMTHGDAARGGRHGDDGLTIGRATMQPIFDFIAETGESPFFVWYAPLLPHAPHNPPAYLVEKYSQKTESIHTARYWAMCEWFDSTCGELFDHLEQTGQTENTIVLFVTDNGWIQRPGAAGYAPRSKRSPYEGGIRTPMMIRWPQHIAPRTVDAPVSSIDIAPTILKACGVMPPPQMSGVDLLDHAAVADRKTIFGDVHLHNAIDIRDPSANVTYRWCIRDGWKLIVPNVATSPQGEIELFNLDNDPHETTNLAHEHLSRLEDMTGSIDAWWPGKSKPRPPNNEDS